MVVLMKLVLYTVLGLIVFGGYWLGMLLIQLWMVWGPLLGAWLVWRYRFMIKERVLVWIRG